MLADGMEALMRLLRRLAAVAAVAAIPAIAAAQDRAQFAGSVHDSSGAFVAGARIVVKNQRTGEERSSTTSAAGTFLITNLKPSVYTVRAEMAGFSPVEYTEMPLAVG